MLKNTYWNSKGKHQKLYDYLSEKLIPDYDEADTPHGEFLRCISRLYHDYYNNGFCNIGNMENEISCVKEYINSLSFVDEDNYGKSISNSLDEMYSLSNDGCFYPMEQNPNWNFESEIFPNQLENLTDSIILYCQWAENKFSRSSHTNPLPCH